MGIGRKLQHWIWKISGASERMNNYFERGDLEIEENSELRKNLDKTFEDVENLVESKATLETQVQLLERDLHDARTQRQEAEYRLREGGKRVEAAKEVVRSVKDQVEGLEADYITAREAYLASGLQNIPGKEIVNALPDNALYVGLLKQISKDSPEFNRLPLMLLLPNGEKYSNARFEGISKEVGIDEQYILETIANYGGNYKSNGGETMNIGKDKLIVKPHYSPKDGKHYATTVVLCPKKIRGKAIGRLIEKGWNSFQEFYSGIMDSVGKKYEGMPDAE